MRISITAKLSLNAVVGEFFGNLTRTGGGSSVHSCDNRENPAEKEKTEGLTFHRQKGKEQKKTIDRFKHVLKLPVEVFLERE